MAQIGLRKLRHSYFSNPSSEADWALKKIDLDWLDGGAYALLGPSGCGKSTLLNIISGLVTPTEGRVLFGDRDVTWLARRGVRSTRRSIWRARRPHRRDDRHPATLLDRRSD